MIPVFIAARVGERSPRKLLGHLFSAKGAIHRESATGRIDLLAPAHFGLSALPIYVARIPAAPFAVGNLRDAPSSESDARTHRTPTPKGFRESCLAPKVRSLMVAWGSAPGIRMSG
jgi:hypothetical protein